MNELWGQPNICKWSHWQGINLQNKQTDHTAQWQKKKNKQAKKKHTHTQS